MMCICDSYDWEEIGHTIKNSILTARQTHQCGECGATIAVGDQFEMSWFRFHDGAISTSKTCAACVEVRRRLIRCDWQSGLIWSDINDASDAIGIGDLDGLSPEAIGKFEEMVYHE